MLNNKKGLSAIVATLIIILLAIVAFGIVSVVVKQTVTKGAESIELTTNCLDIEVHATKILNLTNEGSYNITISRSATGEPINGVKLILTDDTGDNSKVSNDIIEEIRSFDKKTYTVFNVTFVPVKVQVVPFFFTDAGKTHYCENFGIDELILDQQP